MSEAEGTAYAPTSSPSTVCASGSVQPRRPHQGRPFGTAERGCQPDSFSPATPSTPSPPLPSAPATSTTYVKSAELSRLHITHVPDRHQGQLRPVLPQVCRGHRAGHPAGLATDVGIDLGLSAFAGLSDGRKTYSPRFLRRAEKKLRRPQRELSRKAKGAKIRANGFVGGSGQRLSTVSGNSWRSDSSKMSMRSDNAASSSRCQREAHTVRCGDLQQHRYDLR